MSFQEKLRWFFLVGLFAIWGWYFIGVIAVIQSGVTEIQPIAGRLIMATMASIITGIIGIILLVILNRKDAIITPDERDHLIERKAISWGYYIFSFGTFGIITAAYCEFSSIILLNALILVALIAEVTRLTLELLSYRRGY